ncbi:MAG: ABC transporter permease [Acidobacteriia bacterium]|nr:ABC transporter permease [Terriglobia bacterium]
METLFQDLRYGFRMLLKNPGFTAVGILTLALGIGANTAIFSVADAFLLKPLSIPNENRMVVALEVGPNQRGDDTSSVSPANFEDWKSQAKTYDAMAAYAWANVNLTGQGEPEKVQGFEVSPNFFGVVGMQPALGRVFLPEEENPGHEQVAILSHGLWQRRYASDPSIVGKNVTIDGRTYAVIGVMPAGFNFPTTVELWMPLALDSKARSVRNAHYLFALGLLKPGMSTSSARAELKTIAAQLAQAYPTTNKGWSVRVMSMRDFVTEDLTRQYTLMSVVAVAFVLLIACANVANLQFARATSRQREMAVRVSLGAGRWRIMRQLLTESVAVSLLGAALSLLLAQWGIELILAHMPPETAKFIAAWNHISLDYRAFLYTLTVALLTGILSGLLPAFQSSKPDLNEALKEGGRSATAGQSKHRLRSFLVMAEVALALILLVGSGLMVKSFKALLNMNQGLDPNGALTLRIDLPPAKYKTPPQRAAFYEQVLQNLKMIPGVEAAATATNIPYGNYGSNALISVEGRVSVNASDLQLATNQVIGADYFRLMHIPLQAGREFTGQDGTDSPPVALVSELLARRYWPNQNPIGKRVKLGLENSIHPWMTVVGVVGDVKYEWSERDPRPTLYYPFQQAPVLNSYVAIRSQGDPRQFISAVRAAIARVDSQQPLSDIKPLDKVISDSTVGIAYVAVIMSVLAVIALILSTVGVFGVVSYQVTERIHEIGIRMALGANPRDVLGMVVARGAWLTFTGLGIGLIFSIGLARLLASLIFGIEAMDWLTFGSLSLTLALVAMLASYLPARRATRVDPVVALRHE